MDNRFISIKPLICVPVEYGAEPNLFFIIRHYYTSHGIDIKTAEELTAQYIYKWVELETQK